MARQKQYENVSEMLRDLAPDDAFRTEFDERVAGRRLVKQLVVLRTVQGLSQQDVASAIGCTQSRISKLEGATDASVRLGDLKAYAEAVGCELVAKPVPRDIPSTDKVKMHAFAIKRHMDDLAQLAKSDAEIAKGVAGFFHELFVNFTLMLGDSARRLPCRPGGHPYFDLQLVGLCTDEGSSGRCSDDCDEAGSEGVPHGAARTTR